MGKIFLYNFEEKAGEHFLEKEKDKFEVKRWNSQEVPAIIRDGEIVFCQFDDESAERDFPFSFPSTLEQVIDQGGAVVCFMGRRVEVPFLPSSGFGAELLSGEIFVPDSIISVEEKPFNLIFQHYGTFISCGYNLLSEPLSPGSKVSLEMLDASLKGELMVLASTAEKVPFALMIQRGQGYCFLLPSFGEKNVEVAELFVEKILPELSPHLYESDDPKWLDKAEYSFPILFELYQRKEEERKKYEAILLQIERQIEDAKKMEIESFHRLLKSQDEELKQALIHAFKYLGWGKVVDVDHYWKNVIRFKEEDIWLFDEDNHAAETKMKKDALLLVVVKSHKDAAPDEDCALLQKYKGRRMQEFDNTKMKALLVGNYFFKVEAKYRKNPFTSQQIEEAERDGNGLLATYELFKAIKAEKEKRIKKEDIIRQLKEKLGLIQFDY